MQRGAKNISSSWSREISIIKGNIRDAKAGFDGTGYPFKKALSELRKEGMKIKYDSERALYFKL